MKQLLFSLIGIMLIFTSFAQEGVESLNQQAADQIANKVNKGVNFGISLGFNSVFKEIYDARISPIDNKLNITSIPKASFLLSTAISVPLNKGKYGGRYYRKLSGGQPTGPVYYVPFGWCFIATVNLVSFNSAATGSIFNQKIDGGVGIGYRINEDFQIALTIEMLSIRQPRDFLVNNYQDKVIEINKQPVTTLNLDDNDYFRDRYMGSASLKFIYMIRPNKTGSN
jgi:hypothetical protein